MAGKVRSGVIRKARSDRAPEGVLHQGVAVIVACPSKVAQRKRVDGVSFDLWGDCLRLPARSSKERKSQSDDTRSLCLSLSYSVTNLGDGNVYAGRSA